MNEPYGSSRMDTMHYLSLQPIDARLATQSHRLKYIHHMSGANVTNDPVVARQTLQAHSPKLI